MKILHVIASCDRADGGPVEGVLALGAALEKIGHQQELLTLDPPDARCVSETPVTVHALGRKVPAGGDPLSRLRRWARRSPEALQWLRDHAGDYDGVIVDGLWNYSTRMARLALPNQHTPYIVFPHGMLDPYFRDVQRFKHVAKSMLWRINEGPLLAGARAAAFTCKQERILAEQTWRPWHARSEVVGYGTLPPPSFGPNMAEAAAGKIPPYGNKPYLLFLSRLHPKKGCEILLQAYGAIAGQTELDLVMAGPGEENYVAGLKDLAKRVVPQGRVHWPGMLSGDAKWGALYGCEAMVLTSHQENFGVVVAEALGCARPVIISKEVNIWDEISAASAGIVCEDNFKSAREALQVFSQLSAIERGKMGARGRELFSASFDIKMTAGKLVELFSESPEC